MATGIPSKNTRKIQPGAFSIHYPGMVPPHEILDGERASLSSIFKSEGEKTNQLIYGDNLPVLRTLLDTPDFRKKIRLIYIDPPFATGSDFESRKQEFAYSDTLRGAEYLEFLRQRLVVLREILADDGSIYLHLDENMVFQAKLLLDDIFGPSNFRNLITRQKTNSKNFTSRAYGNVADYILFYTKTKNYVWNRQAEVISEALASSEYRHTDEVTGRRYMRVPIHAPGTRKGATGENWRGVPPPAGKHWQYRPAALEEMDQRGEIYWSKNRNPRRKIFLDSHRGVGVQDIWLNFKDANNQNFKITGYPTEKNPALLKRIILASSNEGDIVLDAFMGSGTVADVANQTARKWIGIDNSFEAIKTTIRRLVHGVERLGDFVKKENGADQMRLILPSNAKVGFSLYSHSEKKSSGLVETDSQKWSEVLSLLK